MTGVDPSSVMLRIARAFTRDAGVAWVEGTAESVPLPDGSATVLWSLATVHHWQDVGAGLGEARRVLGPRGRLLAIERRTQPGATGLASHGWTQQQAESFAAQCRTAGFVDLRSVNTVRPSRRMDGERHSTLRDWCDRPRGISIDGYVNRGIEPEAAHGQGDERR